MRVSGKRGRRIALVHRVAYIVTRGEIPMGLYVCHKCDNRKCCNPAHLFLGTQLDNIRDARSKNRLTIGETHPNSKLTSATVEKIRSEYSTGNFLQKELAARYRIPKTTLRQIVRRTRRLNG
jgi:hypothetical protein